MTDTSGERTLVTSEPCAMSSCSDSLNSVMQARQSQVWAQIGIAVQTQQLQAFKDQGAAFNQLLEEAAQLSKSLSTGTNFSAVA